MHCSSFSLFFLVIRSFLINIFVYVTGNSSNIDLLSATSGVSIVFLFILRLNVCGYFILYIVSYFYVNVLEEAAVLQCTL